jgi:hypothetical protein
VLALPRPLYYAWHRFTAIHQAASAAAAHADLANFQVGQETQKIHGVQHHDGLNLSMLQLVGAWLGVVDRVGLAPSAFSAVHFPYQQATIHAGQLSVPNSL